MDERGRSGKGALLPEAHSSLSMYNPNTAVSTRFDDHLGNSFEKYAKINGRDVSPPVRLHRKIEPKHEGTQ